MRRKQTAAPVVIDNYGMSQILKAMNMLDKMTHDTTVVVSGGSLLVDDFYIPTFYNAGTESYVIEWRQ